MDLKWTERCILVRAQAGAQLGGALRSISGLRAPLGGTGSGELDPFRAAAQWTRARYLAHLWPAMRFLAFLAIFVIFQTICS